MTNIRKAAIEDIEEITRIYNEAILITVATFDTTPKNIIEQKNWFQEHGKRYPIIVAQENERIAGWASLSEWSDRCAYSETVEISLYVESASQGRGIGKALMNSIMEVGEKAGFHTVIARIADGNEVSVHIHEQAGFDHIGVMREVGRKFDRVIDVYLMQKIFS